MRVKVRVRVRLRLRLRLRVLAAWGRQGLYPLRLREVDLVRGRVRGRVRG